MSGASTPLSEPAAPPPGLHMSTLVIPADVNDMFDLAAPPVEAPVVARLIPVSDGGTTAALVPIPIHQDAGTTAVGRSKDLPPPFRIDGVPKLSGKHCDLTLDPVTLRVTLTDCSANGTFVNGERVAKGQPVALHAGDTIRLTRPAAPTTTTATSASGSAAPEVEPQVEFVFQRLREETDVKTLVDELTCGVCMLVYHRPVSNLPCMHVFCAACMSRWLREGRTTCAQCRQPIDEVRPTHKIQSCVDQLLLADPSLRRSAAELRKLDELDDIPPAGKILRKRHRDDNDDEGDADGDYDGGGSDDDGGDGLPARLLAPGMNFAALGARVQHPQSACPQCTHPSTLPDRFACVPGGPHLSCQGCRRLFPERPLCDRPQRCHLCSAPYCGRYFAPESLTAADGQPSYMPRTCPAEHGDSAAGRLMLPLSECVFTQIPPETFGGNTTEISILTTHLARNGILAEAVWAVCLEKLREGTWKPDLACASGPVAADSPVCRRCTTRVFASLLFHYRRSIPRDELPEAVTDRSNCWYGVQCRTQFHKPQHAQGFNHVCYQEKRKE